MRTTNLCSRPPRHTVGGRFLLVLALALMSFLPMESSATHAARALLAAPTFPGPRFGAPGAPALTPGDFSYQCTTAASTTPISAAGVTVAAGQGIYSQGCGQAQILLNTPASGHFQASVAVPDNAPAGSTVGLQLLVLGPGGFNIHHTFVRAAKGTTRQADVDVAGGVALALTFFTPAPSVIYHMKLTGSARTLRPVPLVGTGMPAGATLVPKANVSLTCVANPATAPSTISGVTVPLTGTYQVQGCGKLTIPLPAGAGGMLALRYGTDETITNYSSLPAEVELRVLDAGGHLLRKAIGLTYIGGGLQALWVDTHGGGTATLSVDAGGGEHVAVTSISFLPGRYAP
ncbi:MAG: hypothetical protein ACRDGS_08360, partial [Chloroflexota bacterium]